MNKFKGCLIIFITFSLLVFVGTYFYFQKVNRNCIEDHKKVETSFAELKSELNKRNQILQTSNFPDSVKILSKKSDSILSVTTDANELVWTEFQLNEKTFQSDSLKSISAKLNLLKNKYNSELRTFNFSWITFPFNLIKMRQKFSKYNYLEIDYGKSNREKMKQRKKTEHWIETGEWN
ncbi:hypothetical protein J5295_02180 [Riemerella anatipestifer]|uniref:Uncharacterized protein n=1 Tax=Riemerella anatipestifer (strain ATCC 11845 / DSM 15868 / JCM 9532 / NCTC 11014) TaxID=693978 RepID=E4TBE8_RIEAD|nr:hypothetical protein [Riemerella anatipestifer]ADQ81452.1 hypothetical protein Riean_0281 [Riemerella anatipestifer ATCC 11845 = DSM 15868]ADZ13053.1 hypothetical protein RIA_2005 [Riemerella anatipestifer RA-GD]AFD55467.1 hypothetical protein RA0C_0489 [Riemerella anatipestifer ATCC 11845 = DSM 15868]AGC40651.1 hypothetical protein G148_1347 [Riemerella anatipestifer RA-CH-2]AKP68728.1 hypothetical protein CG08_0304 [Riemerella anatipestifer]